MNFTDTGFRSDKDDKRQRQARATAFLNVPAIDEPTRNLKESSFHRETDGGLRTGICCRFGVSPKQKDTAKLVFDKSAQQAGFLRREARGLLNLFGGVPPIKPPSNEDDDGGGNGNGRRQAPLDSDGPDVSGFTSVRARTARHPAGTQHRSSKSKKTHRMVVGRRQHLRFDLHGQRRNPDHREAST